MLEVMQTSLKLVIPACGRVSALWTAPKRAQACYVFAHGAGAGMRHPFMAAFSEGLAERGIASLRYQFPYMEAGGKRPDGPALAHATVRAAVHKARGLCGNLPIFAGGKSFGGRMTSQAQADEALPGVVGLIFLSFPLHPAGKPSVERAAHLSDVGIPMLFVHGARDALAEPAHFTAMAAALGFLATTLEIEDADHGLHVPKRSGRSDADVMSDVLDSTCMWTQAWRL